eukprot:13728514-Alexandrium_andersonii.AAC.1
MLWVRLLGSLAWRFGALVAPFFWVRQGLWVAGGWWLCIGALWSIGIAWGLVAKSTRSAASVDYHSLSC